MNSRTISTASTPQSRRFNLSIWALGAVAVLALLVITVIALGQGLAAGQTGAPIPKPLSGDRFLAQNPELSSTARYAAVQDETSFLARNPELSAARRYAIQHAGEGSYPETGTSSQPSQDARLMTGDARVC